jgi:hypothetical protein
MALVIYEQKDPDLAKLKLFRTNEQGLPFLAVFGVSTGKSGMPTARCSHS